MTPTLPIFLHRQAIILTAVGMVLAATPIMSQPVISPRPDWVTANDFPRLSDQELRSQSGSSYCLLFERQRHLDLATSFIHVAVKILNAEGIQENSGLNLDYDPSYQTLILHQARVHRGNETFDRLGEDPIRTFQRETNLERYLYDGSLTSSINLSDVRIGDIIEYSFSYQGRHPVYDGYDFGSFPLEAGFPIERLTSRLLVPNHKNIKFKPTVDETKPDISREGNLTIYEWTREQLKATLYDNNVPSWYVAHNLIEYSDVEDWRSVVEWALPLFEVSPPQGERLWALAGKVISFSDRPSDIMKAIRFVQDEIRYLGIENGMSAYQPHPPEQVWTQRYGDCKDKSLLLSALLREFGVEAHPMLVNTALLRSVDDYFPSPGAFDHCVVSFRYNDRLYFVDPTVSYQGGDLENLSFADYGYGLIISPSSYDLTQLPAPDIDQTIVTERFILDDAESAMLSVTTKYKGYQAEVHRSLFASTDLEIIQRHYLAYYATLYPEIKAIADLTYIDDSRNTDNEVAVEEFYRIENIWVESGEDTGSSYVRFCPLQLESMVSWDSTPDRTMPYYVGRVDYRHEFFIDLPEPWPITPEEVYITGDGFEYRATFSSQNRQVRLVYEYRRTKEYIEPEDVAGFVTKHDRIQRNLSYYLFRGSPVSAFRLSWAMLTLAILCTAGSVWGARKLYTNFDPEPKIEVTEPIQIRGWLILPAVGLVLTPLWYLADFADVGVYFDAESFSATGFSFAALLVFELIFNIVTVVFWGLVTWTFFQRRTSAPVFYMAYLAIIVVWLVIDTILANQLLPKELRADPEYEEAFGEIVRSILAAVIWIPYFRASKRVARTFIARSPCRQPKTELQTMAIEPTP
jgi:transglutaminase-like putative cysteine protease